MPPPLTAILLSMFAASMLLNCGGYVADELVYELPASGVKATE
jgi:hypothetical protein